MASVNSKSITASTPVASASASRARSPQPANRVTSPTGKPETSGTEDRVSLSKPETDDDALSSTMLGALEANFGVEETPTGKPKATLDAVERIQDFMKSEHELFGGQVIEESFDGSTTSQKVVKPGINEADDAVFERVGDYWKSTGYDFDGKDEWAWSAAMITDAHQESGVGDQFKGDINHSTYIRDAIAAKKSGDTEAAYWGHSSKERAPQVGDMLGYARESGVDYDHQKPEQDKYRSHTDIVTRVGDGFLEVIGGNIGDTVSLRRVPIDDNGMVQDQQRYFVVMEPMNLS